MSVTVVNPDTAAPKTPEPATNPAPVTPEVPNATKPDEMSSKFAALAKKERISRMQTQRVRQLEAQIAERERKIAERERLWDEEFKTSPLEAIKKRGYSYEDLTKAALNDGRFDPATEVKTVKDEIQRLREENAEKERKAIEAQKSAQERAEAEAIESFKGRITETLEANKDKYELTHLYDASGLVYSTVEEHYARTSAEGKPKILSIEEACEMVEKYIEDELDRTATTSKKFQAKYAAQKAKEASEARSQPKSSTTITNDLATSAAPSLLPAATENDRLKRALAALG